MRSTEIKYLQKHMVLLEGKEALKNTEKTLLVKEELVQTCKNWGANWPDLWLNVTEEEKDDLVLVCTLVKGQGKLENRTWWNNVLKSSFGNQSEQLKQRD